MTNSYPGDDATIRRGGPALLHEEKVTVSAVLEQAMPLPQYKLAGVKAPASLAKARTHRVQGKAGRTLLVFIDRMAWSAA